MPCTEQFLWYYRFIWCVRRAESLRTLKPRGERGGGGSNHLLSTHTSYVWLFGLSHINLCIMHIDVYCMLHNNNNNNDKTYRVSVDSAIIIIIMLILEYRMKNPRMCIVFIWVRYQSVTDRLKETVLPAKSYTRVTLDFKKFAISTQVRD